MKKEYCIISHTHWDREWYQSFDMFRMRLVDLMDNLLDIVNKDSSYVFHLDAQTVVLEDYLEIRPEKKKELERYITSGQIIVGPWYVQNDFFLSCGESTVRNLLIGTELAESFGKCGKVSYCPDQFGIIGQLPQIIRQLGLNGFVFGRGNTEVKSVEGKAVITSSPCEFYWQGSDGTVIPTVCMTRWYNNAQRFSKDLFKAKRIIELNEKWLSPDSVVPYRLLMNGVDHLEAQEDLMPILKTLNNEFADAEIYQDRLDDYIDRAFDYIKKNNCEIKTVVGEMRNGPDGQILQGTLSSRVYLKQENDTCENMLVYRLEPLYQTLSLSGLSGLCDYGYVKYLWKELIKNHAHDSICGCSNDIVHRQVEERLFRIKETTEKLISRAMTNISTHIEYKCVQEGDYILILANTVQSERNEVLKTEVRFPKSENIKSFEILDMNGNRVSYTVGERQERMINIYTAINLPTAFEVDVYPVEIDIRNMPPFSTSYLIVRPDGNSLNESSINVLDSDFIENDYYKISLNGEKLSLITKYNGQEIEDFISFEDTADIGDSYNFMPLAKDIPLRNGKPLSVKVNKTSIRESAELIYKMNIPKTALDDKRSAETEEHEIKLLISLERSNNRITVDYNFDNKSQNHRMRLKIKTGVESEYSKALSAFETVERKLGSVKVEGVRGGDLHNAGLITVENQNSAAAVYNTGLHEYEHLNNKGELALTLVRSTAKIINPEQQVNGKDWITPEGQCLRAISGQTVLVFKENSDCFVADTAAVRNGIIASFDSADHKKFSGGRPALQDSEVNEDFFRDVLYPDRKIELSKPIITLDNKNIIVSAFKRGFKTNDTVLRIYNTYADAQTVSIELPKGTNSVKTALMDESIVSKLPINNGEITLELNGLEIVTLILSNE